MSQIGDYSNVFGDWHDQFVVFYDPARGRISLKEGQSATKYIDQNNDTPEIPIVLKTIEIQDQFSLSPVEYNSNAYTSMMQESSSTTIFGSQQQPDSDVQILACQAPKMSSSLEPIPIMAKSNIPWRPTQNQVYDPTTSADPDLHQLEASSKFQ
ncbi:hypothetical protein ACH5RR_034533 [Cinchona calisaya]|uniref:Uncharacterized protein n=1 Tax=Cinchona calisaya TaxID=153742 RepID=A0ABD2YFQ0_9GENT